MTKRYFTEVCVQVEPKIFKKISFEELLGIRKTNESLFILKYKDELYCPECNKAKLTLTYGIERQYLSANDVTAHDKEICDYYYESPTQEIISEYIKQKSPQEIHNQLLRLLGRQKLDTETVSTQNKIQPKYSIAQPITFTPANSFKIYSIPRQKIGSRVKGGDIFDEELFKYYYGTVKVNKIIKYHDTTGTCLNLYLVNVNNNNRICSINIKQLDLENQETRIWGFIKNAMNQLADGGIYEIAFCGEMKCNKVYLKETKQHKTYYSLYLSRSDYFAYLHIGDELNEYE